RRHAGARWRVAAEAECVDVRRVVEGVPVELGPDAVDMRHEAAHRDEVDAPGAGVDRYVDASIWVEAPQLLAEARGVVRAARPESARSLEVEGEAAGAGGENLRSHPRFAQRIDAGDHAPCVEGDVQALEVVRERTDLA